MTHLTSDYRFHYFEPYVREYFGIPWDLYEGLIEGVVALSIADMPKGEQEKLEERVLDFGLSSVSKSPHFTGAEKIKETLYELAKRHFSLLKFKVTDPVKDKFPKYFKWGFEDHIHFYLIDEEFRYRMEVSYSPKRFKLGTEYISAAIFKEEPVD